MKTSSDGVAFICAREGFVDHVYDDSAGFPTIGFGHLVRPGESFESPFTRADGFALMARDLGRFEDAVSRDVLVPLTQCQFDALVSFSYNAGAGALEESTALKLLNDGDYTAGAEALKKWNKRRDPKNPGLLVVDSGLVKRRAQEVALFESDGNAAASDNPYEAAP